MNGAPFLTQKQLFEQLANTGNHYSHLRKGRKYAYFSTGGWSENEELVAELEKEPVWNWTLVEWRRGGHYKFEIIRENYLKNEAPKSSRE